MVAAADGSAAVRPESRARIHLLIHPSRDPTAHTLGSLVKLVSVSDQSLTLADQLASVCKC